MLEKYYDLTGVRLRGANEIDLYPKASDRKAWESIPESVKNQILQAAEPYLNYEWPSLLMMNYMKYQTEDSRDPYMKPYWERKHILTTLVLAECVEHRGRFMPDIINGIYLVCQESTWMDPAHNKAMPARCNIGDNFPFYPSVLIDLWSANMGAVMGWYSYLLGEELDAYSPEIRKYIKGTVEEKLLNRYLATDEHWWLTVDNNWNIFCNGSAATAACRLLDADDPRLQKILERAIFGLDAYLKSYPADGGCEEGAKYYHSNANIASGILTWLKYVTYDHVDVLREEQLKKIADFLNHMYTGKNNYNCFSDTHMCFEGQNAALLYRIGRAAGNENLKILAARRGSGAYIFEPNYFIANYLRDFFDNVGEGLHAYSDKPVDLPENHWIDSVETAFWREKRTAEGLYFSIKGHHNGEHHNHNDVGTFVLHNDGDPVLMDGGIGEYSKTAFSPEGRYTIWAMNSKYHNVPWIGGVEQKDGREYCAKDVQHGDDWVSMDIAPAYGDDSILHWIREVKYDREANEIRFTETYEFTEEKEIDLHFMLTEPPVIADGCVKLPGGMELIHDLPSASYEEVENLDSVMLKHWGHVYRMKLRTHGKNGTISYAFAKQKP